MNPASVVRGRKERLLRMIDVAQAYCGCSKAELAAFLDRDPAKIAPDSGNPKLDLLFNLAYVIDWPIGDLAEMLWGRHDSRLDAHGDRPRPEGTFKELDERARAAHRRGDYAEMRWLGRHMLDMATTPIERAGALMRIGNAWIGDGRYSRALEWLQAASMVVEVPPYVSRMVQVNLASAHLDLWNLTEAEAIGSLLIERLLQVPTDDRRGHVVRAHAKYVVGMARQRRAQSMVGDGARDEAHAALTALLPARDEYIELHQQYGDKAYECVANTCRAAILEMEVEAGQRSASDALQTFMAALDGIVDPGAVRGDLLESWGWWCVSGLSLALRQLTGEARQRSAAVFSNKAYELADASGNWALRERAFCLGHLSSLTDSSVRSAGVPVPTLDNEDLRMLIGTMGRFPRFRPTGWAILEGHMKGSS